MDTKRASRSPEDVFRERLREARDAQGLSQRGLLARLAEIGLPLNQAAIARIESGKRKVSLDEAIALAVALDVAPVYLFLPITDNGPAVKLAPKREVDQVKARRWARGEVPLNPGLDSFRSYLAQTSGERTVSAEGLSVQELDEYGKERERWMRQHGIEIREEPTTTGKRKGQKR